MPEYEMTQTTKISEEGERVAVFGLRCAQTAEPDVSDDMAAVCELVERCNALALDPIHLHEVVCDFAAGAR